MNENNNFNEIRKSMDQGTYRNGVKVGKISTDDIIDYDNGHYVDDVPGFMLENDFNPDQYYKDLRIQYKLNDIMSDIENTDAMELENEYYSHFDCYTDEEKIRLEFEYIKQELTENASKYENYQNYDLILSLSKALSKSLENRKNTRKQLKKIKQAIIILELELNMDIMFFSEIEDMCEEYKRKMTR